MVTYIAYECLARTFSVAQRWKFGLAFMTAGMLHIRELVRGAGWDEPQIERLTDEVERALAGERPGSPYHRYRFRD
jgi:hypothetical protein